ncbi:MAG: hypothetical protein R3E52_13450 [Burkholderiaceae bacterium]
MEAPRKKIQLPPSVDGYYRFGSLPGLIADACHRDDVGPPDHLTRVVIWRDDGTEAGQYVECLPPEGAKLKDLTRADGWTLTPMPPRKPGEPPLPHEHDRSHVNLLPKQRRGLWPDGALVVTQEWTSHEYDRAWSWNEERDQYADRLTQAAQLPSGTLGRLQVVDDNRNEIKCRDGLSLNGGHVHISWLNAWGATLQPVNVFDNSTSTTDSESDQSDEAQPDDAISGMHQSGPEPLATTAIAYAFDGLHWSEEKWKKNLGNKPKWLQACIALPGQRGVREVRWNPVLIGGALIHKGHARQNQVRGRFQSRPTLQPWLETWKTYEADYLDAGSNTARTTGVNPGKSG